MSTATLWAPLLKGFAPHEDLAPCTKCIKPYAHKSPQQDAILATVTDHPGITSRQIVNRSTYTMRQVANTLERLRLQDKIWSLHARYGETGYYLKGVKP